MSADDRTASTSDSRKRRAESATVVPDASNEITHEQVAAIIRAGLAIEEADSFGSCDLGADIADALMPLFAAKDAEIERLRGERDEARADLATTFAALKAVRSALLRLTAAIEPASSLPGGTP